MTTPSFLLMSFGEKFFNSLVTFLGMNTVVRKFLHVNYQLPGTSARSIIA